MTTFLAKLAIEQGLLIDTAAMAAVALVGYLFGRQRQDSAPAPDGKMREELSRAEQIAIDLDSAAARVRTQLAAHQKHLAQYASAVKQMRSGASAANWRQLSEAADALVPPTVTLATNLSQAYDELRSFQAQLMTFAATRMDPVTRLQNRRAMEEQLDAQLSLYAKGAHRFSLAIFSFSASGEAGSQPGDGRLRAAARLLEDCVRGNDIVARYSDDEFVVLMPKTPLAGGLVFAERLLTRAEVDLKCRLWGGVVEALPREKAEKLLSRADSALYSARTQEGPCLFQHNGSTARRHVLSQAAEKSEIETPATAAVAQEKLGVFRAG